MELIEDLSSPHYELDLSELEPILVQKLSKDVTLVRAIYDRESWQKAMVVRWLFGDVGTSAYELLIEITFPCKAGDKIWPFTVWEEMDLLLYEEDRWDVEEVQLHAPKQPRGQSATVTLIRRPNRTVSQK